MKRFIEQILLYGLLVAVVVSVIFEVPEVYIKILIPAVLFISTYFLVPRFKQIWKDSKSHEPYEFSSEQKQGLLYVALTTLVGGALILIF